MELGNQKLRNHSFQLAINVFSLLPFRSPFFFLLLFFLTAATHDQPPFNCFAASIRHMGHTIRARRRWTTTSESHIVRRWRTPPYARHAPLVSIDFKFVFWHHRALIPGILDGFELSVPSPSRWYPWSPVKLARVLACFLVKTMDFQPFFAQIVANFNTRPLEY